MVGEIGARDRLGRYYCSFSFQENISLSFPEDIAKTDITLNNAAKVDVRGTGGGSITINARNLNLEAGDSGRSLITAGITADSISSEAQAGDITIKATENVTVDNSIIENQVASEAVGDAGGVTITTDSLSLTNGGRVDASTLGQGNAGDVTVIANTLEASSGGQLQTTISGNFDAGNITLKVQDNLTLSGEDSGLFANTSPDSTGDGGSIFIVHPTTMIIRDGAQVAVNSEGIGRGGNIDLQAGSLTLDRGTITAETASNQGGNINLTLSDLLTLRNNSQITATAGTAQAGGDGGNITIDAPFIIAFPQENSEISANAFEGKGGNISINTNTIIGIEPRDQQTPLSDITASSEWGAIRRSLPLRDHTQIR